MRPAFDSRYSLHESSSKVGLASVIFPAAGMARRIVLVVGHELGLGAGVRLTAAGFVVHAVRTESEAHAFLGERIPVAVVIALAEPDERMDLVRWVREQDRLAFVPMFVTPAGITVAAAIYAGADDVIDVVADDAADRIAARIARGDALARLALLDPLTQLHNRRFLDDRLQAEVARAKRSGATFSIALVDLDEFKTVNDTFGHTAGDRALVSFARALRTGLRAYDVACRFGGDEFVVLFPDCDATGAEAALANLRTEGDWHISGLPRVTFSAGIAEFPRDGDTWKVLFEIADHNALCAKNGGRDRTFAGLHPVQ
jgi:diguanylate cyclase (GGDEF)-like protein